MTNCILFDVIFHSYGALNPASEGLQSVGPYSVLMAFEVGGIFIVPHLLWYLFYAVSSKEPPP
jgi:hypothetical protein